MKAVLDPFHKDPLTALIASVLALFGLVSIVAPSDPLLSRAGAVSLAFGSLLLSNLISSVHQSTDAKQIMDPFLSPLVGRLTAVSGQMRQTVLRLRQDTLDIETAAELIWQGNATLAGIVNDLRLLTVSGVNSQQIVELLGEIDRVGGYLQSTEHPTTLAPREVSSPTSQSPTPEDVRSLLLQVKSSLKGFEKPQRAIANVEVACPTCGSVEKLGLGTEPGDSAMPTCSVCGTRFHVHRSQDSTVFTRRFGSATPTDYSFLCPSCGRFRFSVRLLPGSQPRPRFCLECFALVQPDQNGARVLGDNKPPSEADEVSRTVEGKSILRCRADQIEVEAFIKYKGSVYGECPKCQSLLRHADAPTEATPQLSTDA
jgi:hypothetical protein